MLSETKEKILRYFYEDNHPDAIYGKDLIRELNLDPAEAAPILKELRKDKLLSTVTKDKYRPENLIIGEVYKNMTGSAFVKSFAGREIFVAAKDLKSALDGDLVAVKITKEEPKLNGIVHRVIDRNRKKNIGEVHKDGKCWYIVSDNPKNNIIVMTDIEGTAAVEGSKVLFQVNRLIKDNCYDGQIVKILGHKNDPGIDIIEVAVMHDIEIEFSEAALQELDTIPTHVLPEDYQDRIDLRDKVIVTIDGADTKDIDDAISLQILENGNYELGVHIAAVSHYVKEGSALDIDAYRRGTSVYPASSVIPMLPAKLSNGICSLNEGEDRLAKSCIMEYDASGKLLQYRIFNSVICSDKKMTYENVNRVLAGETVPDYEPYRDMLVRMRELAHILRKRREKLGSIDFDMVEYRAVTDKTGQAIDIVPCERGEGEKIIEDFMIAANETVATDETYRELPSVYRVHGTPNLDRLYECMQFLRVMGEKIDALPKTIQPSAVKHILEQLKESPNYDMYASMLLRSMSKAIYDINNIGHFGLALKNYTHFTSPIRRYPDLMVHRLLDLHNSASFYENIQNIEDSRIYLEGATKNASLKERKAADCERETLKMKMAEYMENHIGEEYEGIISAFAQKGIYIELYHGIEGLLKYSDMDHAIYIPDLFCVRDRLCTYHIGDKIPVKVVRASREFHQIDVEPIGQIEKGYQKVLQ